MSFPTQLEQFTPAWLARALGQADGALLDFQPKQIGTGQMCDSYRLTLNWARGVEDVPASIIIKCPSQDAASRHVAALTGTYVKEVGWYRDLAQGSSVPAPRCFHADIAEDEVDFVLLLSDLSPAVQGDQLRGLSLDGLLPSIDAAAALHAVLWGSSKLADYPWLQRDNKDMIRMLFPQAFAGFRERYAQRLSPEVLAIGEALVRNLDGFLAREPSTPTLVHGDLRIDNILFLPDGSQSWLVDWQTVATGSGASDLAYLVGTSIADKDERAAADQPAFDHWIAALKRRQVDVEEEALWREYRIGALSGYFMAVFASMNVVRTERGDEMFAVMAERPAYQAGALGSLELIGEGGAG
jgi:hypothetical protein